MKTTFTKRYIQANRGCYSREQVNKLSFIDNNTINIEDILNSEIPLKDKGWFIAKKCKLTKIQKVEFAIVCAKSVLKIYEDKYPDDKRPRQAINAAIRYAKNPSGENRRAAYAADAAAADAAAAYAAAAYAAAAAADAAAADAAAAAAAAYAAYAAADAAGCVDGYEKKLLNAMKRFVKKQNNE